MNTRSSRSELNLPLALPALAILPAMLFLLSGTAAAAPAPPAPAGLQHVTSVEGIHEYLLTGNGLRVLLFPDPSKATATVNITYLVGSRHENYGETGMAHLFEHLMFKGSKNHPNIPDELTSHGCRPNGSTWYDRTNYFETFASSDENLAWALDLEADRMVNSFIAKKDLDSEMTVVRNEFEQGENEPSSVLEDRVVSTAYLWHNYANTTIGCRADIENVPIERLQAFYRTWYQPDNAILVIAGNFDAARVLGLVVDKFGKIPRPTRILPTTYTEEPAQDGERTVTLRRVGDSQIVKAAYHIPAGSHPDFAACAVLGEILGDSPSGRLHKTLVETHLATSVSAWPMQFKDPGLLMLTAELRKDGDIAAVRDQMIGVVEALAASAPTAEEVERARQGLLSNWETAMRNSQWAAVGLSEWAAMGDWRLLFLHRDRLQKVTAQDVQRVAAAYLLADNRTVGMFIPTEKPQRVPVPPPPDVAAMLQGYAGGEGLAVGEEFDPDPARIETRVMRTTLPSGMKLILLPKKTHANSVSFALNLHLGDEKSLTNQAYVSRFTRRMLMRGTKQHSRQEIKDAFDRMKARVYVGAGGGFHGRGMPSGPEQVPAGGECATENLPGVLQLVAEILREPSFPEAEFKQIKEEELRELEEGKSSPQALAFNRLQRHLNPWPAGDVRYIATPEEEIAGVTAVSLDQLAAFHRDFYGVSAAELAIVGDFDPAQVEPLVRELFGDWKAAQPHQRLSHSYRDVPPITDLIETPDKESAVFSAGLRMELGESDPDYPALTLANFMTGGGFLNSRLATRIRQKEGFSYGVGSFLFADPFERNGAFGAFAIYNPANRDGLDRAFREEITKVVTAGFTAEEVKDAQSGWLQQRTVSRSSDGELAGTLASRAFEGRDLNWDATFEKQVAALTPEAIHAAVKRYIDPAKISVVHAGDFAKAAAAEKSEKVPN